MAPSIQSNSVSDVDERHAKMNWDELGFGLTTTDYMYIMKCPNGQKFSQGYLTPYGTTEISPSSSVLNYGQGLFEGLKAYRRKDGGINLFRPEQNALRMQMGAARLCMQAPSTEQFLEAVKQVVIANKRWVPPYGKGSLYIRPLLIGSGSVLGIGPAPEISFLIFTSPIGNFYKGHRTFVNLKIENNFHRSMPTGTGGIKSITNYAPVFQVVRQAQLEGFDDVLFTDVVSQKYVEEVSSCNIFIVKGNVVSTPAIHGTILPGITRKSIMEIALDFGYEVEERNIPVEDVLDAEEIFCTGTAMIVTPVGSVTYQGKRVEYRIGEKAVSHKLRAALMAIQTGLVEDKKGWIIKID